LCQHLICVLQLLLLLLLLLLIVVEHVLLLLMVASQHSSKPLACRCQATQESCSTRQGSNKENNLGLRGTTPWRQQQLWL
jgi:hypothetical protein